MDVRHLNRVAKAIYAKTENWRESCRVLMRFFFRSPFSRFLFNFIPTIELKFTSGITF